MSAAAFCYITQRLQEGYHIQTERKEKMSLKEKKRIMVIGSPGAGKSTFSRKLREITGLPLYYLDSIWHKPDRTNISKEEFDKRLTEIVKEDSWIIDGNYQRTLKKRLDRCDTVFFLDYPLEICLKGAEERIGKKREDLPWLETEFDEEFRQYIVDFAKDQLPEIYSLLEEYKKDRDIVIFYKREEANIYLRSLYLGHKNFRE